MTDSTSTLSDYLTVISAGVAVAVSTYIAHRRKRREAERDLDALNIQREQDRRHLRDNDRG